MRCEEWPLKRVGGARDKYEDVEERETHGDPPCPHARDPDCIRKRSDQMDDECQRAEDEELSVHDG